MNFCKRGHDRSKFANKFGVCKECRRFRRKGLPEQTFFCKRGHLRTPENLYRNGTCKECMKEREKTADQKQRQRINGLKNRLKISIEQYNELFQNQAGKCFICNRHQNEFKNKLAVDHNHKTGEIRALLCNFCNTALGMFKEDIEVMNRAIMYIKDKTYAR